MVRRTAVAALVLSVLMALPVAAQTLRDRLSDLFRFGHIIRVSISVDVVFNKKDRIPGIGLGILPGLIGDCPIKFR